MKHLLIGAALCALPVTGVAHAQTVDTPSVVLPAAAEPMAVAPQPQTTNAVLRAGTEIALAMGEEITTKKKVAKVGQRFQLRVVSDVEVNGVVVIPAGSPAWGELTSVRNKGMWGKSGKLEARLLFVRVNGRQIRLAGTFDDKGITGTAGVVGAVALLPIAGFFLTGTSATFPMNGAVKGFVDEDVPLAIKAVPVEPLAVQATPVPMTVEAEAQVATEIAVEADEDQ